MKNNYVYRKLTAALVTTIFTSLFLSYEDLTSQIAMGYYNNLEKRFLSSFIVYSFYAGFVVMSYGYLVSIGLERFRKGFLFNYKFFYFLLHGLFGAAIGLVFDSFYFATIGMVSASIFACVDLALFKRKGLCSRAALFFR